MSEHIRRSHNVSALLYHIVCPAKYRRAVFSAEVDAVLRDVCLEIAARHEITFLEIGTDRDHVHFLVQSIPTYSPTRIVRVVKSLTAREVFRRVPAVKKYLWGGEFWSDGYYISTVGRHGTEGEVQRFIASQGGDGVHQAPHATAPTIPRGSGQCRIPRGKPRGSSFM